MTALALALLIFADARAPPTRADTVPTLDLSALTPERTALLAGRPVRVSFVPDSLADDVLGVWAVEAAGTPGCLRIIAFDPGEDDEGLDVLAPQVVEGVLVLIRHPARGSSPPWPSCRGGTRGGGLRWPRAGRISFAGAAAAG